MAFDQISMRAGPASLQFDWLKAGLSMDLSWADFDLVTDLFKFKPSRKNLTGLLFCLDLSLSRSTDHLDRNLHSLSHRFQSSSSYASLHLSVNT